jgi:hypothetical protein
MALTLLVGSGDVVAHSEQLFGLFLKFVVDLIFLALLIGLHCIGNKLIAGMTETRKKKGSKDAEHRAKSAGDPE